MLTELRVELSHVRISVLLVLFPAMKMSLLQICFQDFFFENKNSCQLLPYLIDSDNTLLPLRGLVQLSC